jgi:hypothetical protein
MMDALTVLLLLASRAKDISEAMAAVSEVIQNARAQGREATLDEVKQYSLSAHGAKDALAQAIDEAEGG